MVESTDAGMFCEREKEAALVAVIGLSKGHTETDLYVQLAGCQNSENAESTTDILTFFDTFRRAT